MNASPVLEFLRIELGAVPVITYGARSMINIESIVLRSLSSLKEQKPEVYHAPAAVRTFFCYSDLNCLNRHNNM